MSLLDRPELSTALVPQEILALATDYERQDIHRYRHLAFQFLTFGRGFSRLMSVLGLECERRLVELHSCAREIGLSPVNIALSCGISQASDASINLINHRGQALAALRWTEARAEHAVRVAEHLQKRNATHALQLLLTSVVEQKKAERHILQEVTEAYDLEFAKEVNLSSSCSPRIYGRLMSGSVSGSTWRSLSDIGLANR